MNREQRIPYENDGRFSGYYLEDSYVLGISEQENRIIFNMDLVLTPTHPDYRPPSRDEQYCYRKGNLIFEQVTSAVWKSRSLRSSVDAKGERDFGNIDSMFLLPNNRYMLEGSWGALELTAQEASITLTEMR